jgi:hypothetical protein
MKFSILALLALSACAVAQGTESTSESLAPSPTESVGCEPHGDHWYSPIHPCFIEP